jgi:type I site-specific restriction endonuclease
VPEISTMTPEQKARELIDDQLHQTGWAVQSAIPDKQ